MFVVAEALIVWRSIQSCGDYCVPFLCCFVFKQCRVQHSSNASFFVCIQYVAPGGPNLVVHTKHQLHQVQEGRPIPQRAKF